MKPITIQYQSYDKGIFNFAKRAMNQATINNRMVLATKEGEEIIIYPNDNWNKVLIAIKAMFLKLEIQVLRKALN
jgi:hypothetical protein